MSAARDFDREAVVAAFRRDLEEAELAGDRLLRLLPAVADVLDKKAGHAASTPLFALYGRTAMRQIVEGDL